MDHLTVAANGASFHLARNGAGKPLLLLHGWPEFWLTWEPVMQRLAPRHAHDVLFPPEWIDRLGETFTDLDVSILPDVGHFPHREDPDRAAAEVAAFFARIPWD